MGYYFNKKVSTGFDENVDFRNYRILGACNPHFAYKALQAEDKIELMLPCNVTVQETPEGEAELPLLIRSLR